MRTLLSYFFTLMVLFPGITAWAQSDQWDRALDSYQTICDKCILLRERSLRGDEIAPEELTSLLEQVSSLRATLQKGSGSMSKAQKERFERIKGRYTAAFQLHEGLGDGPSLKVARPEINLPRIELGPALRLCSGTGKTYLHPDTQSRHPEGAKRPKDLSPSIMILGGWSSKSLSYGAMATITGRKLGAYIKGRSNFKNQITASYLCLSDGTSDGVPIWTTGEESHTEWVLGAGGIIRLSSAFSLYAGSGYGRSETFWEDSSGRWAKVEDYSSQGICADAGLIFTKGHFTASAGIRTINLGKPALEVGIGVSF